jgi:cytochrome c peroxidase
VKIIILSLLFIQSSLAVSLDQVLEKEPISPISEFKNLDQNKMYLGKVLFFDKRLSHNNTVSCSSCHDLQNGGVDHRVTSIGINQQVGKINAPTVFNSGLNYNLFWDGRATSLEEQIEGPIHNKIEMGSNWDEVIKKLSSDPYYKKQFIDNYGEFSPISIKKAIAYFERTLLTPNSRFDQYIKGDQSALNVTEIRGYHQFKAYGCIACHQGENIGGNMFQKMGLVRDYFKDRGNETTEDQGRYNVTHLEKDRHVFRVPSLRNVSLTAPYFHDGSAKTLEEAVSVIAKYQLGRKIPESDSKLIVEFLKSLIGNPNPLVIKDPTAKTVGSK